MAERKAGNRSACARLTVPRRGHRPCPSAPLHLVPPGGAKPPRPVPAPPARMKAPSSLPWQRPSPLPQRVIAPCPAGGQKPPGQRPSRLQYESNLPFVRQAFETCPLHGRNMHETIHAPAIRRNKAETPGAAEPLHGAFRHAACLFAAHNRGSCRASRATPSGPRQGAGHARRTAPDHKKESSAQ